MKEKTRSIRFPEWLWDEIDREAVRAKRSAVKQMEVVLSAYYGASAYNINSEQMKAAKDASEPTPQD